MVKVVTLNIEGDKHLSRIIEFLDKENADVVCFQELFEADIALLQQKLGLYPAVYVPLTKIHHTPNIGGLAPKGSWGIGIFCKSKPTITDTHFYVGSPDFTPLFSDDPNVVNRAVAVVQLQYEKQLFTIATTHLTWVLAGQRSVDQELHVDKILSSLQQYGSYVLCGDFNAPRGEQTYTKLANALVDTLPATVTTTIDPQLHRVKGLSLVVDSIFTTNDYRVQDIRVVGGVSDHQAVVATLTKD